MGVQGYAAIVKARWMLVALVAVACLNVASVITLLSPQQYIARASMYLAVDVGDTAPQLARGTDYERSLTREFAEVGSSSMVLQPAIDQLGLRTTPEELRSKLTVRAPTRTVVVEITVKDSSARRAAEIANAVTGQLSVVTRQLAPTVSGSTQPVVAETVSRAAVPTFPVAPRRTLNVELGLVLGLLAGVATAVAVDARAVRVDGRSSLALLTDAPVIGTVGTPNALSVLRRRDRWSDDRIARLRSGFAHLQERTAVRSVLVTSAFAGATTSTTVSQLAVASARAGQNVLLIDADMRRPTVAPEVDRPAPEGLFTLLDSNPWRWEEVVRREPDLSLTVLEAGPAVTDPSALLGSRRMEALLSTLTESYDLVLVKAPPVLRAAEALALSRLVDGVVVVTDGRRMSKLELSSELDALRNADARLLGVVLAA